MFRPFNPSSAASATSLLLTLSGLAFTLCAPAARADYSEFILHTFDTPGDGQQPTASLAQTSDDSAYSLLHSFGNGSDAAQPGDDLTLGRDGAYYGVAATGGSAGIGVVYRAALTSAGISYSIV